MSTSTASLDRVSTLGRLLAVAALALAVLLSESTAKAASFEGVGDLSGGFFRSGANGVSADGSVVVGASNSALSGGSDEAFRWEDGEMVGLGDLPGDDFRSFATAVSADGSVVVGQGDPDVGSEAFRWEGGEMVGLGELPGNAHASVARDVSADGSVIVGQSSGSSGTEAVRWDNGAILGLGHLPGGSTNFSRAEGVSADGSVIVGYSRSGAAGGRYEAFRWEDGNMVGLGFLPGRSNTSRAYDISADGSVIVGMNAGEAFRWENDEMVGLGFLPGGSTSSATGVSADGSVIVGLSRVGSNHQAFLWDVDNGMRNLENMLVSDFGLDLTGWTLERALGVSDDGTVIVGNGVNPDGSQEGWIARLTDGGYRWADPVDGAFSDATNWVPQGVPGESDATIFDLEAGYTVTLTEDAQVGGTTVHAGDVTLDLAGNRYESGDVTIDGPGASLTFDGGEGVGVAAAGASSGGDFQATDDPPPDGVVPNIFVREGEFKSIRGTSLAVDDLISVNSGDEASGAGSRISGQSVVAADRLIVGDDDQGVLIVDDGSELTVVEDAILGDDLLPLGNGIVDLFGGSKVDVLGEMLIGNAGDGTVHVKDGSVLSVAGRLVIADNITSDGNLFVSGSGIDDELGVRLPSTVAVEGDLEVSSDGGDAKLSITNGGVVGPGAAEDTTVRVGPGGTVVVGGADPDSGTRATLGSFFQDLVIGRPVGDATFLPDAVVEVKRDGLLQVGNIDVSTVTPAAEEASAGKLIVTAAGAGVPSETSAMVQALNLNVGPEGEVSVTNNGSIAIGAEDVISNSTEDFRNLLTILDGGALTGTGSIEAHFRQLGGTDDFTGARTMPGSSPGKLSIVGDADFLGGILEIEIKGLDAETQYDVLDVSGDVTIDGAKIVFDFIDGFAPQQGHEFDFLSTAGSVDLGLVEFEIENLLPGFQFDVAPTAGGLRMTALNNGVFAPDAGFVPEPGTFALAMLALAGLAFYGRRAKR